jgi:hypothetical protein
MKKIVRNFSFAIIIVLSGSSCVTGSRGYVTFDALSYPVSMSPFLYDEKGKTVQENKELKIVGKLDYVKTVYAMVYTRVTFNPDQEFGPVINKQISHVNGDGVINLEISSRGCVYNYIPVVNLFPFWLGCTVISLDGDIVKYEK